MSSLQISHREPSPEFQLNERLDLSEISFVQIFAHLVAERLISHDEVNRILSELRGSDHSPFVEHLFELNDSIVAQLESAVITVAERTFQQKISVMITKTM